MAPGACARSSVAEQPPARATDGKLGAFAITSIAAALPGPRSEVLDVLATRLDYWFPATPAVIEMKIALARLQRGRDWIWIAGNHDPEPVAGLGGVSADTLAIGTLAFRHKPASGTAAGEIAGHLHPVARVSARGRTVSRRCFVGDGARIVMPAFGTYAGGLNVRARAFAHLFGTLSFTAHMLGEGRVYPITAKRCLRD